jgi:RecA-family ATPase
MNAETIAMNSALAEAERVKKAPPVPEVAPKLHPLARFLDFDGTAKPPRWVIPGFIGHGVVVVAGAHGVGKTTAILPLALVAAGLHGDQLMPRQWRHVVYITEDVEQARRILSGVVRHSNLGISLEDVRERLHIVDAVRLDPSFVAQVGTTYREQFTRTVDGVELLPLVVLDTKSAVLALDNENDNSEASAMMAALKQGFAGLPVWLIGHVAKANLSRSDVTGLSSRGASAIEGDANQTIFLVREGDARYLVLGKTRFEPRWTELEITSHIAHEPSKDEFGNVETVAMRWGTAAPAEMSRKEAAEQATERQRKEDAESLRGDVREAVQTAWQEGFPLNREGVKAKLRRDRNAVTDTIENLLSERWLHEVAVPAKERTNPKRARYLVNLDTSEHEAAIRGAGLPPAKLVIPESWRRAPIPSVLEPEPETERGASNAAPEK